ncbi:MAG: hypothetical protein AB7S38_39435 [Vulcanimicrobiota bacterium]
MRRSLLALLFACSLAAPALAQSPCIIPPYIPEQHEFTRDEPERPDANLWVGIDLTRKPSQVAPAETSAEPEAKKE